MQIVIDIPDYTYEAVKEFVKEGLFDYNGINATLHKSVANGAVLPKGHGRLIDADAILEEPFGNTYRDINIAETIIEADKENKNKDEHMTADEFAELFTGSED